MSAISGSTLVFNSIMMMSLQRISHAYISDVRFRSSVRLTSAPFSINMLMALSRVRSSCVSQQNHFFLLFYPHVWTIYISAILTWLFKKKKVDKETPAKTSLVAIASRCHQNMRVVYMTRHLARRPPEKHIRWHRRLGSVWRVESPCILLYVKPAPYEILSMSSLFLNVLILLARYFPNPIYSSLLRATSRVLYSSFTCLNFEENGIRISIFINSRYLCKKNTLYYLTPTT